MLAQILACVSSWSFLLNSVLIGQLRHWQHAAADISVMCFCFALQHFEVQFDRQWVWKSIYTVFQKKWRQNSNHYNYGTSYQN